MRVANKEIPIENEQSELSDSTRDAVKLVHYNHDCTWLLQGPINIALQNTPHFDGFLALGDCVALVTAQQTSVVICVNGS